ncbi:delta-like protein 3 [Gavia stellata]|uniref:delta-like protein 3 n=1 Tax=Gavia stellata TaxID=37040 RepID=UPI0028A022C6|nr:delta-like protein 3 [Gavia stellata]
MAALLLAALLALLCPPPVQPAGVLELRVLSARGGPGGPCGGPPSCRLVFRLCLRPPGGVGCSLGVTHSPPGPPPAPGAPRILRLPFAFPWPGTISLVIESWRLEEAKGSGGPQDRLLGRVVARQHLSPGGPWRGGAGGGLRFGTRLRCRPPARGPRCAPRCPPCARRCPLTTACRPPNRCWPHCCAHRGCREACAPPGTDGSACTNGGTCMGHGSESPVTRCDTPGPGRPPAAPAAVEAPVAPAAVPAAPAVALGAPAAAPAAPAVALEAPVVVPVASAAAPEAPAVAPAAPATAPEAPVSSALLPAAGQLAIPEPLPEVPPSPCALGPCFNGGACAPAPAPGAGYTCRCPPGFRGSNCERRADRCADHLCLHGGQCRDLGRGAICKCRPGFSGRRCERNADDCTPNPCANGGTCQDGANTFTCSCTLGYAGADCRRRADACASGPCLNGATCYTHFSGHVCACPPGFMGSRCEEEVGGPPPAPQRRPPAPLALACALPLALLGPGVGLALAARRRRRLPGESSRVAETGGAPGANPPGRERRLPRASATRV